MLAGQTFATTCPVWAGTGSAVVRWTTARVPCREPQGDGIAAVGLDVAGKAVRDGPGRGWGRNGPAQGAVGPVANCFGQFARNRSCGGGSK